MEAIKPFFYFSNIFMPKFLNQLFSIFQLRRKSIEFFRVLVKIMEPEQVFYVIAQML